ncbi:hypothetical protein B4W74_12390 [Staphylococcus intermedius]|uniref:hypothetical protein n=1 Tax=Staphylococcus intermedius TaxID=1285 RepID=UPI000BBBC72E|nr:hypothetical protein [Staphylococcus intermedius]PCF77766.1 hypothetical protein B4W74_12390 [Staphylococcus intermedius]PCF78156.1 hypothetical protein B4W70_12005 [Staphylococcus intermedius]
MLNMNKIYDFILHGSIEKYKYKNSKATDLEKANFKATKARNWRSARIAVSPTKELLQNGYGVIFSSEEALVQYGHKFSHWTPKPYNFLSIKKEEDTKDNKVSNLYAIVDRTKGSVAKLKII